MEWLMFIGDVMIHAGVVLSIMVIILCVIFNLGIRFLEEWGVYCKCPCGRVYSVSSGRRVCGSCGTDESEWLPPRTMRQVIDAKLLNPLTWMRVRWVEKDGD